MKKSVTAKIELTKDDVEAILVEHVRKFYNLGDEQPTVIMQLRTQTDQMDRGPGYSVFDKAIVSVELTQKTPRGGTIA